MKSRENWIGMSEGYYSVIFHVVVKVGLIEKVVFEQDLKETRE